MKSREEKDAAFKKSRSFCFVNWRDAKSMKFRVMVYKMLGYYDRDEFKTKDFTLLHFWYADQNYYFIKDDYSEFFYIVTWYKGRGGTDCILFQGSPITEGQMDYLLKTMRKALREAKKR